MTSINSSAVLPSQAATQSDAPSAAAGNSFISNLSNVKPEQAAALADKTFLALGKDGIKFLPFLTAFVKAFDKPSAGAPSTAGADAKVDVGAATQSMMAFRNANPGVKNLDQAMAAMSKALPNLSQGDFDSLLASFKTAAASAGSSAAGGGSMLDQFGGGMKLPSMLSAQPEIDKLEMGLLEGQIAAAVDKNTATSASGTGNKALDAVVGAIAEIAKDGVTPDEMESLMGILSATATALLGPEKAAAALATLDAPQASGQPGSAEITVTADKAAGGEAAAPSAPTMGRNSYDPMMTVKTNLLRNATASNRDPSSTNEMAYQLFIAGNSALSGGLSSGKEFSQAKAESKKPVSSADLS